MRTLRTHGVRIYQTAHYGLDNMLFINNYYLDIGSLVRFNTLSIYDIACHSTYRPFAASAGTMFNYDAHSSMIEHAGNH